MVNSILESHTISMGNRMNILKIDRAVSFDPTVTFLGDDWSIVWEDERSLKINEVDLSQVPFRALNFSTDSSHKEGMEDLVVLMKAQPFNLDAKVLQTLYENMWLMLESWKAIEPFPVTGLIPFCGTVVRDADGIRYFLCLEWFFILSSWRYRCCVVPLDSLSGADLSGIFPSIVTQQGAGAEK